MKRKEREEKEAIIINNKYNNKSNTSQKRNVG